MQAESRGVGLPDKRMEWMDAIRGAAIVLVLIWHAASIPTLFGFEEPPWLLAGNNFLRPFRMPTLMFLSGILLQRSLGKPLGRYFYGKFSGIVWPYIVWNLLQIWFYGSEWAIFQPGAWVAAGYLWFLFFIAGYYALAPLFRGLPPGIVPALALALSLVLPSGYGQQFCYFAVFFFLGDLSKRYADVFDRALEMPWVIWVATVVAVALGSTSAIVNVEHDGWLVPFNLAGILAIIAWGRKLDNAHPFRLFRDIGRNSLVFYTAHFAIMTAAFLGLLALGATNSSLTFPVLFIFGAGGSFLLAKYRGKPPCAWLFSFPGAPSRGISSAQSIQERP